MPIKTLLVGVALLITLIAGILTFMLVEQAPRATAPQTAMLFADQSELPEFELLDHDGNEVGRDVFKGHWNLVFFGFTHCPDICPMTLTVLADAAQQLQERGLAVPRIVLVSVDPERDTPDKLGQYIDYFGEGNLGLTGDLGEIRKLTTALGIFFEKAAPDGDNYSVDHSAVVMIIGPDGRQHGIFSSPHVAGNFVNDLPIIMASQ